MPPRDVMPYDRSSFALLGPAADLADKIARTEFVPKTLRGRPDAILACILAGHEAGIPPMTSLQFIDIIDGRPAPRAQLARMLILSQGHRLWIEETTMTRCTVCGQRAGEEKVHRISWTLDDAQRAGIAAKDNWRKYPRQMLIARATGDLARIAFADVLGGMPYLAEELEDGGFDSLHSGPVASGSLGGPGTATAPVTHRRRRGRPPKVSLPTPETDTREEPPIEPPAPAASDVEDQAKTSLAEHANLFPAHPPPAPAPPVAEKQPGESLTLNQQIAMLCRDLGFDRGEFVRQMTGKARGRDLTREDAGQVLERLRAIHRGDEPMPRPVRKQEEGFIAETTVTGTALVTTADHRDHWYEITTPVGPFVTRQHGVYERATDWEDLEARIAIHYRMIGTQRVILGMEPVDTVTGEEFQQRWATEDKGNVP